MATVNVLVGQCGNQLGAAFLNALAAEGGGGGVRLDDEEHTTSSTQLFGSSSCRSNALSLSDYHEMVSNRHFRLPLRRKRTTGSPHKLSGLPEPRCVLVDMEKQVISQLLEGENKDVSTNDDNDAGESTKALNSGLTTGNASPPTRALFEYSSWQCASRNEGSGNNWAFGYLHQGPSRRDAIENCLRRELEACDTVVRTFHVVHSIAGGTGSGVGSFVAEVIKELQPHTSLLHSAVWPFENGEVATQWFNLCLTLSALRDTADAVHLLFNDEMVDHLVQHGAPSCYGSPAHTTKTVAAALHELDMPCLNRAMSALMLPLHVPQHLYAVPPPQMDHTKHRMKSRNTLSPTAVQNVMDAEGQRPLRFAHSEDVVDALAMDPAMKFFTSTGIPRITGCGPSTWGGVVTEAARGANQIFNCVDIFSSFYTPRSCLWCLRGPEASTQGVRELQHFLAVSASADSSPQTDPSSPFYDTSSSSTHSKSGAGRRFTIPLSSLLIQPSLHTATTSARGQENTPNRTTSTAAPLPCLSPQIHLYGATPSIGQHAHHAAERAQQLLHAGAYTHHYERYGLEREHLMDAVVVAYDVAAAYRSCSNVNASV